MAERVNLVEGLWVEDKMFFYPRAHHYSFARVHCIQPVYLVGATQKMSDDSNIV